MRIKPICWSFRSICRTSEPTGRETVSEKGLQLKQTQVTGYYGVEVKADCYADGLRIEQGVMIRLIMAWVDIED